MKKYPDYKITTFLPAIFLIFLACTSPSDRGPEQPFIKGVYGNPGSLLKAGYAFDSLGMNAVFVRSISLNRAFYDTTRFQGCKVFVEFPTLIGRGYVDAHPDAWPVDEKGEQSPPADWFMGVCPTNPGFRAFREKQLKELLTEFAVDGIFLDYLHWHAQFESADPILPETCFCDHCTGLFADYLGKNIPGEAAQEKAAWILEHADPQWRAWRNTILNGWVSGMKEIVKEIRPDALVGVYYCAWYPADHDSALFRILGIDVAGLAGIAEVMSPMLFHKMKDHPVEWPGEYVAWLDHLTGAGTTGKPLIWPIVQAHNQPGVISPEEFRQVMLSGSKPPASGIMMFSDVSLLQDPEKIEVMKALYHGELNK